MVFDERIETDRLLIRRLCLTDAEDMYEYTSNPIVTMHLHWHPHKKIDETRQFIAKVLNNYDTSNTEFTYGIELKSERKLIGVLKIMNICYYNKRAEFTSILNPKYQGKGFMGEAWQGLLNFCFNNAGLHRIQSNVTVDNVASINKNIRAGLTLEGRLKDYWIMKGQFKDALVYAITSEMFRKKQN